jgi:hypothetical protein
MHLIDKPIFRSTKFWYPAIVITFLIIVASGYVPQIARSTRSDLMGRDSIWQHLGLAEDYHAYLSKITLGQHGYTMYRNPNNTEKTPPLPFYFYYLAFGWITGPFHIWPPYVYHFAKLIAEIAFVLAVYYLARVILKKPWQAGLATIISLITTTLPERFYNQTVSQSFMSWWVHHLSAPGRLDNRPHYAVSGAFLALAIALYFRFRQTDKARYLIGSGLSGILCTLMVPQAVVPYLFIIGFVSVIRTITFVYRRMAVANFVFLWTVFVILCIPILGTIWILQKYVANDIVWSFYQTLEVPFWNKDPLFGYHMYLTFIPLIIPSIITWICAIRKKNIVLVSLFGWTFIPLLMYPFLDALTISKFRLLHSAIQIPLAITATYAVVSILPKYISKVLLSSITVLYILYSFTMIGILNKDMWVGARNESPVYSLIYLPSDYMEAIKEIGKRLPADSHFIAGDVLSNVIPSFSPVITYTGCYPLTYRWHEKMFKVEAFYSSRMTTEEAYDFLRENGITYVISDTEIKAVEVQPMKYPFLNPVWSNASVTLFNVE